MHLKEGEANAVTLVAVLPFGGHLHRARAARDGRLDAAGAIDLERDRLVAKVKLFRSVQPFAFNDHELAGGRRVRNNLADLHGAPFNGEWSPYPQEIPVFEP